MPEQDRVEQIHRFIDEHAAEIRSWDVGKITLDWVPGDIKFHLGRSGKLKPVDRAARLSA